MYVCMSDPLKLELQAVVSCCVGAAAVPVIAEPPLQPLLFISNDCQKTVHHHHLALQ